MFCRNCEKWVFTLERDFSWPSGLAIAEDVGFDDKTGVRRLELRRGGEIKVLKGYSWDGCSPKVCLFDMIFGTPDGAIDTHTKQPKAYYASMVHDALYQFLPDGLPLSRAEADGCLLSLMRETGFAPRRIYWLAVRILGSLFVLHHRYKRKNRGTIRKIL